MKRTVLSFPQYYIFTGAMKWILNFQTQMHCQASHNLINALLKLGQLYDCLICSELLLGPISRTTHRNSNSMENWIQCYPILSYPQEYFAYAMTAQLSCHVQIVVAIDSLQLGCEHNEISTEFELRWKNRSWNGPNGNIFAATGLF